MSAAIWVGMAALGAVGAVARVVVTGGVARRAGGALYLGTVAVNLAGAFALGLLVGLRPDDDVMRLVGTALLGSFTTFSAWMLEVQRLLEDGRRRELLALLAGSLVLGLIALAVGRAAGHLL
jgi:CrcB protein